MKSKTKARGVAVKSKLKKHGVVLILEGDEVRVDILDQPPGCWTVTKRSRPEQAVRAILRGLGISAEVIVEDWDKMKAADR